MASKVERDVHLTTVKCHSHVTVAARSAGPDVAPSDIVGLKISKLHCVVHAVLLVIRTIVHIVHGGFGFPVLTLIEELHGSS